MKLLPESLQQEAATAALVVGSVLVSAYSRSLMARCTPTVAGAESA